MEKQLGASFKYEDLFLYLSIVFYLLRAISGDVIYIYLGIITGILVFINQITKNEIKKPFLIFLGFIFLAFTNSFMNNGFNAGSLFIPLCLSSLGVAMKIFNDGISTRFCKYLFYFAAIYYFIAIFIFDFARWDVLAYSRNYISVFFLNLAVLFYISESRKSKNIDIFPAIITFLISFHALGLGGIISASIFLFLVIYFKYFSNTIIIDSILFLFAIIFFINFSFLDIFVYLNQVFQSYYDLLYPYLGGDLFFKFNQIVNTDFIYNNPRSEIIENYNNNLNLSSIFFGYSLDTNFSEITSNVHNSFILMHMRSGFWFLLFLVLLAYSLMINYFQNKLLFTCFLVLIIRAFFDTTIFAGSSFDFIFIYLMLFSKYINSNKKIS